MVDEQEDVLAPLAQAAAARSRPCSAGTAGPGGSGFRRASCSAGQLVAAITRTSIGTGLLAPTGITCRCSSAVSSLGWRWSGRLPISSRNRRAAIGRLHAADAVAARVGEGALHMAEQLGFEQILGDRAEVDRNQHLVGAARAAVELARDQLLAGAVLAEDQDVGLGRRRPARPANRPAPSPASWPSRGMSPPAAGAATAATRLRSVDRLLARRAQRGGGAHGRQQPLVRPGLGDEVGGAALHRLDRDLDAGMGGDHHHHRLRVALQDLGEPVEAFGGVGRAAAEIGVEQDDVGQLLRPSPPAPRRATGNRRPRGTGRAAAAAPTAGCPDRRR